MKSKVFKRLLGLVLAAVMLVSPVAGWSVMQEKQEDFEWMEGLVSALENALVSLEGTAEELVMEMFVESVLELFAGYPDLYARARNEISVESILRLMEAEEMTFREMLVGEVDALRGYLRWLQAQLRWDEFAEINAGIRARTTELIASADELDELLKETLMEYLEKLYQEMLEELGDVFEDFLYWWWDMTFEEAMADIENFAEWLIADFRWEQRWQREHDWDLFSEIDDIIWRRRNEIVASAMELVGELGDEAVKELIMEGIAQLYQEMLEELGGVFEDFLYWWWWMTFEEAMADIENFAERRITDFRWDRDWELFMPINSIFSQRTSELIASTMELPDELDDEMLQEIFMEYLEKLFQEMLEEFGDLFEDFLRWSWWITSDIEEVAEWLVGDFRWGQQRHLFMEMNTIIWERATELLTSAIELALPDELDDAMLQEILVEYLEKLFQEMLEEFGDAFEEFLRWWWGVSLDDIENLAGWLVGDFRWEQQRQDWEFSWEDYEDWMVIVLLQNLLHSSTEDDFEDGVEWLQSLLPVYEGLLAIMEEKLALLDDTLEEIVLDMYTAALRGLFAEMPEAFQSLGIADAEELVVSFVNEFNMAGMTLREVLEETIESVQLFQRAVSRVLAEIPPVGVPSYWASSYILTAWEMFGLSMAWRRVDFQGDVTFDMVASIAFELFWELYWDYPDCFERLWELEEHELITRGQVINLLYLIILSEVNGEEGLTAADYFIANGLMQGRGDGEYMLQATATVEEMLVFLVRVFAMLED